MLLMGERNILKYTKHFLLSKGLLLSTEKDFTRIIEYPREGKLLNSSPL